MPSPVIRKAYARLGLMGNPTDRFHGTGLTCTIQNYYAEAIIISSDKIILQPPDTETTNWENPDLFLKYIHQYGYYGGSRLMKALLNRFFGYWKNQGKIISPIRFTLSWKSNIPNRVGLGGSSALLTAALRAIMDYTGLLIPPEIQIDMILKSETDELKIPAGPMDRIAQIYDGLLYFETNPDGTYHIEKLDTGLLPPLFVAIDPNAAESTEVIHSSLEARFQSGDPDLHKAVEKQKYLVHQARNLLKSYQGDKIGPLMNENFDIRKRLIQLNPKHLMMVQKARELGAYAKFAGSGGTIVGTTQEKQIQFIIENLIKFDYIAFRPTY